MIKMLVAYYSRTGHTKTMAEAIAEGARQTGALVDAKEVREFKVETLLDYDAIVLGSPSYYGSMAAEIKHMLDASITLQGKLTNRVGGAFATCAHAGGGAEITLISLIYAMMVHGMVISSGTLYSPLGPVSLHSGGGTDVDQECRQYGKVVAQLAAKVRG